MALDVLPNSCVLLMQHFLPQCCPGVDSASMALSPAILLSRRLLLLQVHAAVLRGSNKEVVIKVLPQDSLWPA